VTFSPDGGLLATACGNTDYSGTVEVWDAPSGRYLRSLEHERLSPVQNVVFSPDGRYLAAAARSTAKVWEVTSGRCLCTLPSQLDRVNAIACSPDGQLLATAHGGDCKENAAKLWDRISGQCLRVLSGKSGGMYAVAFSPDGRLLATGGSDIPQLWDV